MSQNVPEHFFEKVRKSQETEYDNILFSDWLKTASETEIAEVLDKFSDYFENQEDALRPEGDRLFALIERKIYKEEHAGEIRHLQGRRESIWPVLKWAISVAAILCVVTAVYYLQETNSPRKNTPAIAKVAKIVPGGNKAILTLANGSTIVLDSAKNGILASQNNVHIFKKSNGQLLYDASNSKNSEHSEMAYNTISTPRGGQYELQLPDGSKVWLNAQSSLRFPAQFIGNERLVTLTGEGYFEVAKDKAHPFKISINNMQVEVLGTHFNVMGYNDEPATTTTLLEGSVKIIKGGAVQKIVPGEQAIVKDGIMVAKVNAQEAVEWKNGRFNFSHEKLDAIMRRIARWYDVDIAYTPRTTRATFVGTIPRSTNITEVLKYLELTGLVHFKIEERRVTVMP